MAWISVVESPQMTSACCTPLSSSCLHALCHDLVMHMHASSCLACTCHHCLPSPTCCLLPVPPCHPYPSTYLPSLFLSFLWPSSFLLFHACGWAWHLDMPPPFSILAFLLLVLCLCACLAHLAICHACPCPFACLPLPLQHALPMPFPRHFILPLLPATHTPPPLPACLHMLLLPARLPPAVSRHARGLYWRTPACAGFATARLTVLLLLARVRSGTCACSLRVRALCVLRAGMPLPARYLPHRYGRRHYAGAQAPYAAFSAYLPLLRTPATTPHLLRLPGIFFYYYYHLPTPYLHYTDFVYYRCCACCHSVCHHHAAGRDGREQAFCSAHSYSCHDLQQPFLDLPRVP